MSAQLYKQYLFDCVEFLLYLMNIVCSVGLWYLWLKWETVSCKLQPHMDLLLTVFN